LLVTSIQIEQIKKGVALMGKLLIFMAGATRLELATSGVTVGNHHLTY